MRQEQSSDIPRRVWINPESEPQEGGHISSGWTTDEGDVQLPQGLVFVPKGDAALTRALMPKAASALMRRESKRYPSSRVGLLVQPEHLADARRGLGETEKERGANRETARKRRVLQETEYQREFREMARRRYPKMPGKDLEAIVERATPVGSGTVGRSRRLIPEKKVDLAVQAHVRHAHTDYDQHLAAGRGSSDAHDFARNMVRHRTGEIIEVWRDAGST